MHRVKSGLKLLTQPRRLMGRFTGPKVLVTSVPKAGTNMLMHTLGLFPQLRLVEPVAVLPLEEQLVRMASLRPGQVISAHVPVEPALDAVLDQHDIRVVFISRDPRDVCVSFYHYMMRDPELGLYHAYYQKLPDDHSRLMTAIIGIEEASLGDRKIRWPSIDTSFRERLSWLTHPRCCVVTFEELVGPNGGGDGELQRAAIRRIAEHIKVRLTARDVEYVARNVFSTQTRTFRRGQIGSWQQEMTAAHRATFKEIAGQLLVDLGYETGFEW